MRADRQIKIRQLYIYSLPKRENRQIKIRQFRFSRNPPNIIPANISGYTVYSHATVKIYTCENIQSYVIPGAHEPPEGLQGASNYVQQHLILSGSDSFLIWAFPQVGNLPLWSLRIRVKQAQRTACRRAPSASCFSARAMRIRASTMELGEEIARAKAQKRKAVTPHRPAKRPRLFQTDQQETELRQRRTFRKWWHNLVIYYAANLHGSCVNSAKSA